MAAMCVSEDANVDLDVGCVDVGACDVVDGRDVFNGRDGGVGMNVGIPTR